jgi:hypothetical protein
MPLSRSHGCYVVLHIRPGPPYPDPNMSPQIGADSRFELGKDTWIEKLETGFAARIQKACEPAHHNVTRDVTDNDSWLDATPLRRLKRVGWYGLSSRLPNLSEFTP